MAEMIVTAGERYGVAASPLEYAPPTSFLKPAHFCDIHPIREQSMNLSRIRRRRKKKLEVFSAFKRHQKRVLAEISSDGQCCRIDRDLILPDPRRDAALTA